MKFITNQDELTIKLEGLEVFFAMRSKLVIPKSSIKSIKWLPEFTFDHRLWKIFGAGIPGVLAAGGFRGGGLSYFLYLKGTRVMSWTGAPVSANNLLDIELDNFGYNRVLLTATEADAAPVIGWSK